MSTIYKTLPAWKYYIWDPCYAINNNYWQQFVDKTFEKDSQGWSAFFEFYGYNVLLSGTAYGDWCYQDNHWNSYAVDAGLIGILPIELVAELDTRMVDDNSQQWLITEFKEEFDCEVSSNWIYQFWDYVIDTTGEDDYEDEDNAY